MKALVIVVCIVLALVLVSLVRVGGLVTFSTNGLFIRIRLGVLRVQVFPLPEKKQKKERRPAVTKKKKHQKEPEEAPKPTAGGAFSLVRAFLPVVTDAAGRLKQKIRVDQIRLELTVAAEDPAAAAMAYGGANAAVGMLWPLLEHNFNIKERDIRTEVDFQAKATTLSLFASCSLTIGQGVSLAVRLFFRFMKCATDYRTERKAARQDTATEAADTQKLR